MLISMLLADDWQRGRRCKRDDRFSDYQLSDYQYSDTNARAYRKNLLRCQSRQYNTASAS